MVVQVVVEASAVVVVVEVEAVVGLVVGFVVKAVVARAASGPCFGAASPRGQAPLSWSVNFPWDISASLLLSCSIVVKKEREMRRTDSATSSPRVSLGEIWSV